MVGSAVDAGGARAALALAASADRSEHELTAVFFHGDGVSHALPTDTPSDEWSASAAWSQLALRAPLLVCPTSLARRTTPGQASTPAASAGQATESTAPQRLAPGFDLGTLGDFADRLHDVDRVVRL